MKLIDIVGYNIVINCKTKEEANELFHVLKDRNVIWNGGDSLDKILWVGEDTCYRLINVNGNYCLKYGTINEDYIGNKVIPSSEFIKSNISILDIRKRIYIENR